MKFTLMNHVVLLQNNNKYLCGWKDDSVKDHKTHIKKKYSLTLACKCCYWRERQEDQWGLPTASLAPGSGRDPV